MNARAIVCVAVLGLAVTLCVRANETQQAAPGSLGERTARLERNVRASLDRAELDRLSEVLPDLERLEADLEVAVQAGSRRGRDAREHLELLELTRWMVARVREVAARGAWRQSPPPVIECPPDVQLISLDPGEDGETVVTGAPGALDLRARVVRAVNLHTADQAAAAARPDGSFSLKLFAPPGSALQISQGMAEDYPEDVARRLRSASGLNLDKAHEHLRGRLEGDPTSSPGVILPVRSKSPGGDREACFVGRLGRSCWFFGTAVTSRRRFDPGERGEVEVELTVRFESQRGSRPDRVRRPEVHLWLSPLFDRNGRQTSGVRVLATHVLTPLGLPIETHTDLTGHRGPDGRITVEPSPPGVDLPHAPIDRGTLGRQGRLVKLTQRFRFDVPANTPSGTYRLSAFVHMPGLPEGAVGIPSAQATLGRLVVGDPASPRLACMLLGSAGTNGSRATIAREDFFSFALRLRVKGGSG
ncbi:hypothetical protein ACFL59_14600 [Planctomycetota bacterium]